MRTLSSTLLAAQRSSSRIPYIKVEALNKTGGVVRYKWERLYSGSEDDYFHAVTMPADGSLVRVRITPPADSRKLYRQRVASPGSGSDFSQWTYCNQYNAVVVAACSLGTEVSIFWIRSSREIYQMKSTDYGASWGSPALIGYTATTGINGVAAAYKTGGDIALFFADQATLYVMKYLGGSWGSRVAWGKSTGNLSGVSTIYDDDWNVLVTGQDSDDNFKLWSVIYGDGGDVTAGSWSELKELASAPSDGDFEFHGVFLDKPDVYRTFFIEKFTGTEASNRPFWMHTVPGGSFSDNLWREPVPFNLESDYGLAMAHHGDYGWLTAPCGVWRALLTQQSLDLTGDVLSVREDIEERQGRLTVELRNDDGRYASPGSGSLAALDIGCQLAFAPGYQTSAGNEVSSGQSFTLDAYEYKSSGKKAAFTLYASDAWSLIEQWQARHQFRWNKTGDDMNVKDILSFVLARAGVGCEVKSQSSVITGYYPDFTVHPGNLGTVVVSRLLNIVPDVLFVEGMKAYLVNPQSTDSSVYSYGTTHAILEGKYGVAAAEYNRVEVEGYDPAEDEPVIVNSFNWDEIGRLHDRLKRVEDRNLGSVAAAGARGQAHLREAAIHAGNQSIAVPVNCGQQLYDVIDITDSRAGLDAEKRRVLGLTLIFDSGRPRYEHRLTLGVV